MKHLLILGLIATSIISCKDTTEKTILKDITAEKVEVMATETEAGIANLKINPISHATMVLEWDGNVIYVDPIGGAAAFKNVPKPDLILITDIHGDHMSMETVTAIATDETGIITPAAVAKNIPDNLKNQSAVIENGKTIVAKESDGFSITAIPMYNLREEALKFHTKGRGNGYVIEHKSKRVYISGDTEDIPEMRALKNIDVAFVCMNLPYTMTVDSAADAVIEFAPKKVYPYHYRGTDELSDVAKFKTLVNAGNPDVEVVQLDWYAE
ncbi:Zn-dependent hydrolases of the beta-lactamase fold-like protein [unidentified eubacterium SCB49]|nr:Zn-dependent hydrolases of the beta-lactamase fold-like protein [unidentified eubacterium SCB49]